MKAIFLILITILIGLNSGRTVIFPDCNAIVFSHAKQDGVDTPIVIIGNDTMKGFIRLKDILWIKFIPNDQAI